MFCGQLSTIYMFTEALSPQQIASIYELGPSYKSQFRFMNESAVRLSDTAQKVMDECGIFTGINQLTFFYVKLNCFW